MTYVNLFLEELDLALQIKYLDLAANQLNELLQELSDPMANVESLLNTADIFKYLKLINLQQQVVKSLQANKISSRQNSTVFSPGVPPKIALAEQMLVLYNFELAFGIIQEFRLPVTQLYCDAAKKIAKKKQFAKVEELLKNIKGSIEPKEWDEIIKNVIWILVQEMNDMKTAEKFADKLMIVENQIAGYITCQKLRTAYRIAVKYEDVEQIKIILFESKRAGEKSVAALCEQFLTSKGIDV